ncbi:MAG: putative ABC transporter permease [Oscillospiraceae bacterium]
MFYTYCWYVFIYAFLGWCSEVIFAASNQGRFVNRGFLNGPLCPIYGFGVAAVIYLLAPLSEHLLVLYVGSVLLTSLLELVTGFLMEKLFHQKWWDYSDMPFNLGGYICLAFSLMWGIVCVLIVRVIHPLITGFVSIIPTTLGIILLCVFSATAIADLIVTLLDVAHFNRSLGQLDELAEKLDALSFTLGSGMSSSAIAVKEKSEILRTELTEKYEQHKADFNKRHQRLLTAFPNLKSRSHYSTLEQIKLELQSRRNRRNRK